MLTRWARLIRHHYFSDTDVAARGCVWVGVPHVPRDGDF